MKKIIICVLSLSIVLVGAFSVAALSNNSDLLTTEKQTDISTQPGSSELNKPIDVKKLNTQKQNIFNNILNCTDYYDSASGTFETTFVDNSPVTISYDVNIPEQISLQIVKGANIDFDILCKDGLLIEANNKSRNYIENRLIPQYDQTKRIKQTAPINEEVSLQKYYNYDKTDVSKERVRKNAAGEMEFYYKTDLTNASMAATSINPQNLVFGFMSEFDSWKVANVEEYLGRQVIVITGKTADSEYASKLRVDVFEMKFDIKTGILLDFKGCLSDGTLTHYLTTSELEVDGKDTTLYKEIGERVTSIINSYENAR